VTPVPARLVPGPCREEPSPGARASILNTELFRDALARERKRSDRSGRPFALLLIEAEGGRGRAAAPLWEVARAALAVARGEADLAGAFDGQPRLGVIMPQLGASDLVAAGQVVDRRFRRELARRLDSRTVGRFRSRLHLYPEARSGGSGGWPVDPVLYPDLERRWARRSVRAAVKRSLDVVISLVLLLGLAPLFLLIAALVKWSSSGPIVFRQLRSGHLTKPFTMLKFRTMYRDADHRVHREFVSSFIKADGGARDQVGRSGVFKLTNDPRVTPVGRWLRSTSLDELPQLWNVLRGDMSLVGPRPPLPYELEQYQPWHRRRVLEAKPGITGIWQVAGRSRTTFDEMVRLDLRYAARCSLWADLKILLATPAAVVSRRGAC
jgi:lipopolysaccharide/colanic/teichoic acid biosynthesis glycosyltransferase